MLLEHEFVTTMPEADAIEAATAVLHRLDFEPTLAEGRLTGRRGKPSKTSVKRVRDLPQSISIAFDRGRVELAALLEHRGKSKPIHRERLLLLTETIETAMRDDRDDHALAERWYQFERDEKALARKISRNRAIAWSLVIVGLLALLVIALIVVGSLSV